MSTAHKFAGKIGGISTNGLTKGLKTTQWATHIQVMISAAELQP